MKHLTALAFCLSASVVSAQSCTDEDSIIIPEMEAAKDAVFDGNYETFGRLLGSGFQGLPEGATEMFAPFRNLVRNGYTTCTTILQRHEKPGFYQDITMYTSDDYGTPIALLLIGAEIDGEFAFLEFKFNTSFVAISESLR